MGENKRWFKVWNSILTDPGLEALENEYLGIWTRLGCLLSLHGERGILTATGDFFEKHLRAKIDAINALPNVILRRDENDNDKITVTLKNWSKYQKDSTVYERVKNWRKRQNDNGVRGEEKRREEKREEIKKEIVKKESPNMPPKLTPQKSPHGEFGNVMLTDQEMERLIKEYAEERAREMIEILSSSLASRPGNKYSSHYAVIRNWERRGWMEGKKRGMLV